jgi:hypothetical protein
MTDPPWEPPLAGDESGAVFGALDRLRMTFRWKCADLDAAGLAARTGASALILGGLIKHLAVQEDYCFQVKVLGKPMPAPWDLSVWETEGDDWEFESAANDSPEELYDLGTHRLRDLVPRSRRLRHAAVWTPQRPSRGRTEANRTSGGC